MLWVAVTTRASYFKQVVSSGAGVVDKRKLCWNIAGHCGFKLARFD